MEATAKLFRERLYAAYFNWLDVNRKTIGEKWYSDLYNKAKDAEAECNTIMKILGNTMWMLNMISNLGVSAGIGPNHYDLQGLAPGLDEASTKQLLAMLSSMMCLQGLPIDMMEQEMPLITAKHFSLSVYVKEGDLNG